MRVYLAALALLAACTTTESPDVEPAPEPGDLLAGVATARIPAPVGIGTAGFGPTGAASYDTPYSDLYPGTKRILGHPEVKAVALTRGEGFEVVFVRLDAVGMFSQLRRQIVNEVSDRIGRDMDDAILIGATHTHSGPGRVLNSNSEEPSVFDLVVDRFHPEFYDRFVDTVASTIVAAIDDARPARIGTSMATCSEGHDDRRCEDGGNYENPDLPMIAVERDGQVDAVVFAYAVHGTVLSIDDSYLSQDVSGAIEQVIEDRFDHPVEAVFFNSWGADMSPSSPDVAVREWGDRQVDAARMLRVGSVVADAVHDELGSLVWTDEPEISLRTIRQPINRELIGYEPSEFNYEFGAVFCGLGSEAPCDPPERQDWLDGACLPFGESFPAPIQTDFTFGTVADFTVVTWPGEAGTELAELLMARLRAEHDDIGSVMFLGYTQDYLGYSILEDDWWNGGYESSGSLWGPRQGEYLLERAVEAYGWFAEGTEGGLGPLEPFPYTVVSSRVTEDALDVGTLSVDVAPTYGAAETITVAVNGRDPWLGAPLAWIETADGTAITRPNGAPLDSDTYDFDVELSVEPPYADLDDDGEVDVEARTFSWQIRTSTRSPLMDGYELAAGSYRIAVAIPLGDGTDEVVYTSDFEVSPL